MSFIYSRALVAEFSRARFSDTDASEQSKTLLLLKPSLSHDRTMEPSRLSQYGMTCEPLTERFGEVVLTWFAEDFLVRTSVPPAEAMAWKASEVGSGRKWLGLLARYDRDSSSWKTPQSLLLGGWGEFSETWPAWGSMRTGECWERTTPELRTCGTAYGLWPTPCATDSSDRAVSARMHETKNGTYKHIGKNGVLSQVRLSQVVKHRTPDGVGRLNPDWVEWLMGWPIGHTELKPLAMDKYREWQLQHSPLSPPHEP